LSVELECERVAQQKILVALEPLVEAGGGTTPRVLAKAGLALYLQGLADQPDDLDEADLAAVLANL
ncbi:MAG: hypothetical protein JNL25_05575, partial [Rhodospirillaceae bacterium]|nr:hypothetical protein [Rhodospirillaceae bacterium]